MQRLGRTATEMDGTMDRFLSMSNSFKTLRELKKQETQSKAEQDKQERLQQITQQTIEKLENYESWRTKLNDRLSQGREHGKKTLFGKHDFRAKISACTAIKAYLLCSSADRDPAWLAPHEAACRDGNLKSIIAGYVEQLFTLHGTRSHAKTQREWVDAWLMYEQGSRANLTLT